MEIIASFVLGFALGILGTHFAYMVYIHIYLTAKFDALLDKAERVPKSLARTYQWASLMTDVISYATRAVTPQPEQSQRSPARTVKRRTMAPPERIES